MIGWMIASVGGSGAVKKRRSVIVWACRVGKQICRLVESNNLHAVRRNELIGVGVLRQLDRLFHKRSPDRRRSMGALKLDIGIVVVTHPDYAEQAAGEAGEPCIVAGASFTGRRCGGVPAG